nr:alpha-L-arabinofuranosidase [Bifidobacterium bifidum]
MEYCNRESGTDLARLRAQNGHPAPYHVKYWGSGNEAWAGGGFMTPAAYAAKYREFATAMPSFKHDLFDKEKI